MLRAARTVAAVSLVVAMASVVGAVSDARAEDAGATAPALPACIGVATEARYVPYGYNHLVTVKNGCSKAASCAVSTDVNPQPSAVEIAAGQSAEVLTFSGSPAQTFTARVTCRLH